MDTNIRFCLYVNELLAFLCNVPYVDIHRISAHLNELITCMSMQTRVNVIPVDTYSQLTVC